MINSKKRDIDVLVISDVHLGTYGCKAKELLRYLKSVRPKKVILNGDIIDIWQFSKSYFPASHMKIIKYITSYLSKGVEVYYVTGNHDEMLRKFKGFELGDFKIVNKLNLDLEGQKTWVFHGDVFDITMQHSKWLAKLGGIGYDMLILINTLFNWISEKMGRGRISFSKNVKKGVKGAIGHINNFEKTVTDIALEQGVDTVICGHIHEPKMKMVLEGDSKVLYLNSGDWVESLTALEFVNGGWSIYEYSKDKNMNSDEKNDEAIETEIDLIELPNKKVFQNILSEFNFISK